MPEDPTRQPGPDEQPERALDIPKHKLVKGGAANLLASGIESVIKTCKATADFIRNAVDRAYTKGSVINPRGIKENTWKRVADTLRWAIKKSRKARIIEKVDYRALPSLIEEDGPEEANIRLQCEVVDAIDSSIGVALPFREEIDRIGKRAFDMGVPPEKLIAFFEDDQILDLLIDGVLDAEHSRFRAQSISALIYSSLQSVFEKLKVYSGKQKRLEVEGEIEKKIRRNIAYLGRTYDPTDIEHTITSTIRVMQAKHPDYDIITWLKNNKHLLVEVICGLSKEERDLPREERSSIGHMEKIINGIYEERGKVKPKQFIKLNVPRFIENREKANQAYLGRKLRDAGVEDQPFIYLDIDELREFFEESLTRMADRDLGISKLRNILLRESEQFVRLQGAESKVIVARRGLGEYFITTFERTEDLIGMIGIFIRQYCPVISSHVDVVDILANPEELPPEIKENYYRWFEDDGTRIVGTGGPYYRYIRKIFGLPEDERFERVNDRVEGILESVNSYVDSVSIDLGIPRILNDRIRSTNDYAQLTKLAFESQGTEEGFLARLKIELAILTYSCLGTPRWVFKDHEALAIKVALETARGGVAIHNDAEMREVEFIDGADGDIEIFGGAEHEAHTPGEKRSFKLIPAKFGGIPCFLLPGNCEDEEEDDPAFDPHEFIGKKSLHSMLTKLLHKEQTRARDITDVLRTTIVVDTVEDLMRIQRELETNYISFGRSLKRENRYGKFVKVSTYNVGESAAKSDEYRALRYVAEIPIKDTANEKDYLAPIEIRILLTEDLVRERSKYHPASHRNYEERRLRTVMNRLAPPEIFGRLYKMTTADEDDVFGRREVLLKGREDYGQMITRGHWPQTL